MARRRAQPKYTPTPQASEPEVGVWKSEYSRETPRTWEMLLGRRSGSIRIVVTRHIHYSPDDWVLACEPWFTSYVLKSKEIEDAKREAIERVLGHMREEVKILENQGPA